MNFISKAILSVVVGYNYFNDDHSLPVETKVTHETMDEKGYPVIHVQAANYREASRPVEGTTYPGDVSRSVVKTGKHKWEIRVEEWNTRIDKERK